MAFTSVLRALGSLASADHIAKSFMPVHTSIRLITEPKMSLGEQVSLTDTGGTQTLKALGKLIGTRTLRSEIAPLFLGAMRVAA